MTTTKERTPATDDTTDSTRPYTDLLAARDRRDDAHRAARAASNDLRAVVRESGITEPAVLRVVLGCSWHVARDLLKATQDEQLPKRYAWAKRGKKTTEGAKPFSGRITVGYVDEDGNPVKVSHDDGLDTDVYEHRFPGNICWRVLE